MTRVNDPDAALEYHELTRHGSRVDHPERLVSFRPLDPTNRPAPFKRYRDREPVPLPRDIGGTRAPATEVLSGTFAGRELELVKTLTTLGRPGVQVAAITRRAEGYYIVHVESGKTEGFPLVNGMQIGAQARKLQDNDVIQLAGVKMGFFLT